MNFSNTDYKGVLFRNRGINFILNKSFSIQVENTINVTRYILPSCLFLFGMSNKELQNEKIYSLSYMCMLQNFDYVEY